MATQRKAMACRPSSMVNGTAVAVILFCLVGSCMAAPCKGKSSWPELVGLDGRIAAAIIQRENHHVKTFIVKVGPFVTQDFRCDRVWVWVKAHGMVVRTPMIG